MKISKYIRLGFFVVVTLIILGWGINFLRGNNIFNRTKNYYVVYEHIDGLKKSNKVMLRGFQIGQVADISFTNEKNEALLVTIQLNSDLKLPVGTNARIVSDGIMGTKAINLLLGKSNQFYNAGDTLHASIEEGLKDQITQQVLPIKEKAESLMASIDSVVTTLNTVLGKDSKNDLRKSFENINKSISHIEAFTGDVRHLMANKKNSIENTLVNIDSITSVLKNNMKDIDNTLSNLSAFSDSLSQIPLKQVIGNIENATARIETMIDKAASDSSTMGMLLNDDELYYSINSLTENLDKLAKDLRTNPSKYLKLSFIDRSKDIYVNPNVDAEAKGIKFYVTVYISPVSLDVKSDIFKNIKDVKDYLYKGKHYYYTVDTYFYAEALKELNQVKELVPSASIVAFKNGRKIKLEKALRMIAK